MASKDNSVVEESLRPPQDPPIFDISPDTIVPEAESIISRQNAAWDHIVASVPEENASFETVIVPMILAQNESTLRTMTLQLFSSASSDDAYKIPATEAREKFSTDIVKRLTREDIFKLISAVVEKKEDLDTESARYLDQLYDMFVLSGLGIPKGPDRDRFKEIKQRLADIRVEFTKNTYSDKSGIWFTPEELDGVPEDWIASRKKEEVDGKPTGRVWVTFKRPDCVKIAKYAKNWHTRRAMWLASESRYAESNGPLLKEAVVLRDEAAHLMGEPNHAAVKVKEAMVKDHQIVRDTLNSLREQLGPKRDAEFAILKDLKHKTMADDDKPDLYLWDKPYYDRLYEETQYSVDQKLVSEYFSMDNTLPRLLGIFEHLFGIRFQKMNVPGQIQCSTWHEDVKAYAVWNAGDEGTGFLGYLYLDLFPRDNKYDHNGHMRLVPGFDKPDGTRNYPVSAVVMNMTRPTDVKPSLLERREMISLFHEIGHAMHNLLSITKYARFHGTAVATDIVETPSKMLENFFWEVKNICDVSLHYSYVSPEYAAVWRAEQIKKTPALAAEYEGKDLASMPLPPRQLPSDIADRIVSCRYVMDAITELGQVSLSLFDLHIHSPASHDEIVNMNLTETFNKMKKEIVGLCGPETDGEGWQWGYAETHFRHMIGRYDAGYYSYLVSTIYAQDIYQTFFAQDSLSATQGRRWRHEFLEKGGSQDEWKTLTDYLGRDPSTKPLMVAMDKGMPY